MNGCRGNRFSGTNDNSLVEDNHAKIFRMPYGLLINSAETSVGCIAKKEYAVVNE
jgi:hypothetical protein